MTSLTLAGIGRAALDLIYPPRCVACGRYGAALCDACLAGLPRADARRCDVCWLPLRPEGCHACAEHAPAFAALRSVCRYEGQVRHLVRAFKYDGQSSLAPVLGSLLREAWLASGLEADVVVPVPMTGVRSRRRGYNQAALLARELARGLSLPVNDALARRRFAGAQARSATAEDRRRNVVGAFSVAKPELVAGRTVLLVDDIATTGATLDACARALLDAGASRALAITLARED